MNEEKLLIENFRKIANKGYIKSTSKGIGSIGLTFEHELGKVADSTYFPDYYGIELKCTTRFSRYPIHLFSVAFDGPTYPEINRLIEKYGWYDKTFKDKKVLFTEIHYSKRKKVNNKYYFKLEFDENLEKLYLKVYDLKFNLIEKESYVYTQTLYNHLCLKLSKLAIIKASIKRDGNEEFYRYYSINIFSLISFDKFIELLKNDDITVELVTRISKSGDKKGNYRNKNLVFNIKKDSIEKLFKQINFYNNDDFFIYN